MSKPQFFQMEVKSYERVKEGVRIKGFASTPDLDRHSDIVHPTAFQKTLSQYQGTGKNIPLLRAHKEERPVGRIPTEGEDAPRITDKGFFIHGIVTEKETAEQVEAGELQTLSVAIIPTDFSFEMIPTGKYEKTSGHQLFVEARIIKEVDLVEVSVVATPANPNAVFTLEKSVKDYFTSHPSPTMEHSCNFCTSETKANAAGKIGDRFICKGCMSRVEFKGEDVKPLEEEKPAEKEEAKAEEPKEEPKTESKPQSEEVAETTGEKPVAEGAAEKAAPKGDDEDDEEEEKMVVTPEQKGLITKLAGLMSEADKKTVAEEAKATEAKDAAVEVKALDVALPIMVKMAEAINGLKGEVAELRAKLAKVPVQKGRTITAMQHGALSETDEKSSAKEGTAFVQMLKSAKADAVTVGNDD